MTPIILIQWLGESQSNWTLGLCQNSMVLNFVGILMSVTIVYAIFTGQSKQLWNTNFTNTEIATEDCIVFPAAP